MTTSWRGWPCLCDCVEALRYPLAGLKADHVVGRRPDARVERGSSLGGVTPRKRLLRPQRSSPELLERCGNPRPPVGCGRTHSRTRSPCGRVRRDSGWVQQRRGQRPRWRGLRQTAASRWVSSLPRALGPRPSKPLPATTVRRRLRVVHGPEGPPRGEPSIVAMAPLVGCRATPSVSGANPI